MRVGRPSIRVTAREISAYVAAMEVRTIVAARGVKRVSDRDQFDIVARGKHDVAARDHCQSISQSHRLQDM